MDDLTTVLKNNSILIGGVDIVEQGLSKFASKDEPDISQNHDIIGTIADIKKEMRIRIGTMLKTDNVSFLLGAGASKKCGRNTSWRNPRGH